MGISKAELKRISELQRKLKILTLEDGLTNFTEKTNPNYKFLYNAIKDQEYERYTDVNGEINYRIVNGYVGCILEGSSRCFEGNQKVHTLRGNVRISNIEIGDQVRTYNEETKIDEYRRVNNVMKFKNKKKSIRLTLKSGETIECTDDHEFYYKGAWVCAKQLVSLWHERNMETTTVNAR